LYKKTFLLLILLLANLFLPLQLKADSLDAIRIAGDENHPPYEFIDRAGNYKGFNVDIMRAISDSIGRDIEIIPMPWQDAVDALEAKEVDAIPGLCSYTLPPPQ